MVELCPILAKNRYRPGENAIDGGYSPDDGYSLRRSSQTYPELNSRRGGTRLTEGACEKCGLAVG